MLDEFTPIGFVPTIDFVRARAFYSERLGLQLESESDFALVYRAGETTLRVVRVETLSAQPFTILGWPVDDVDAVARELRDRGVVFEKYPFVEDPSGIWTAPDGSRVAWFKDPDGNVLSISQAG